METMTGIVGMVLKEDSDKGTSFLMVERETPQGLVEARLTCPSGVLAAGDAFYSEGKLTDSVWKGKPMLNMRAKNFHIDLPTTDAGATRFLRGIFTQARHGISEAVLIAFVKARGVVGLRAAVADPGMLVALSSDVARFRADIQTTWEARTGTRRAIGMMQESGMEENSIERVTKAFPRDTFKFLRANPYAVAAVPEVGFGPADMLGKHLGVDPEDSRRVMAAAHTALRTAEQQGHTAQTMTDFLKSTVASTRLSADTLRKCVIEACRTSASGLRIFRISEGQDDKDYVVCRVVQHEAESQIVTGIVRLLQGKRIEQETARAAADALFADPKYKQFDAVQRLAVLMGSIEPVAILTGGPGTGKSTVMSAFVELIRRLSPNAEVFLTAPTGKAADRLAETTGRETCTLQSLLGQQGDADSAEPDPKFRLGAHNRLPSGCVVVVDEASMLDASTAAALMDALPDNGRVLLVGDRFQLNSVGAGNVLGDLLAARVEGRLVVPSVGLVNVYRTGKDSGIAKGAALMRDGITPQMGEDASKDGTRFLQTREEDIVSRVQRMVMDEFNIRTPAGIKDVAVLSPQAPGPSGTFALNRQLSTMLNPKGVLLLGVAHSANEKKDTPLPRVGDRIMINKTDKVKNADGQGEVKVTNGEQGFITGQVQESGRNYILLEMDSMKKVRISAAMWRMIPLSYAGTIHKSQGSQYSHVVMVCSPGHAQMVHRSTLYTGWTRAQKGVHVVGDHGTFSHGVKTWKGDDRTTLLPALVRALQAKNIFSRDIIDWEARRAALLSTAEPSPAFRIATAVRPVRSALPSPSFGRRPNVDGAATAMNLVLTTDYEEVEEVEAIATPPNSTPLVDAPRKPSFLRNRAAGATAVPALPVTRPNFGRRDPRASSTLGRKLPTLPEHIPDYAPQGIDGNEDWGDDDEPYP